MLYPASSGDKPDLAPAWGGQSRSLQSKTVHIRADQGGEGDECDCGERDFWTCVCDMDTGTVVSGVALFRRGRDVRGQGGAVRGSRRSMTGGGRTRRIWPGRSTCVIGSVGERWAANGWPWRAGDITCWQLQRGQGGGSDE